MARRQYVYECQACRRWWSVPTLHAQRIARLRGTCPGCTTDEDWRLRVYIRLVELHLDEIVGKGKAAPESRRDIWRRLYRKRQRQFIWARERLEGVEV